MSLGRFGGVYGALRAGHMVGDYWTQTNTCALVKGGEGWPARRACVTHVVTLTATQAAFLALAVVSTGERLGVRRTALGLGVNAVSHYVADRRSPLRRLAGWTGKGVFYEAGSPPLATGAHALDQAWHDGWCAIAAAIIAGR